MNIMKKYKWQEDEMDTSTFLYGADTHGVASVKVLSLVSEHLPFDKVFMIPRDRLNPLCGFITETYLPLNPVTTDSAFAKYRTFIRSAPSGHLSLSAIKDCYQVHHNVELAEALLAGIWTLAKCVSWRNDYQLNKSIKNFEKEVKELSIESQQKEYLNILSRYTHYVDCNLPNIFCVTEFDWSKVSWLAEQFDNEIKEAS
tara:strand:+ start:17581 stop:18180 length:600 start_codon:yes stop_codon:yes gene_type:complete